MRFFNIFLLLFALNVFSQQTPETEQDSLFTKVDSLYREDQFYFSVTYNRLIKKLPDVSQNGLSTGISVGFLRDMPINKSRTFAIATGLGLSYNKYHDNLVVSESGGQTSYHILMEDTYSRNKMEQLFLDVPLEIRWRNSTPESHKFWRVYAGFKVRYLLFSKTKYIGEGTVKITNNPDINKIQYGPFFSLGYNTWNFHIYYALNPIFKSSVKVDGEAVNMHTLNMGLMFYIL